MLSRILRNEFVSPNDITAFSWFPDETSSHGFDFTILSITSENMTVV